MYLLGNHNRKLTLATGIENEFIKKIHAHEGIIHKVLGLYVDNRDELEDVKQEVLLQTWKSSKNFRGQSAFSTWLYKVSLNTVLTFRKKDKSSFTSELDDSILNKQEEKDAKEHHELLYLIIKTLDEIDRMIATIYLDGYKNIEIAKITGMSANQINVKVYRIKNTIKTKFKNYTS
ncbi:MAG: sigma-70 family RNA polymerase sigma factor [Saprospiraceae bacterium]|nr:sigma-70 family RNA polymerase sigma factor [Saprospiraceae bacterium]|tara:strand:+ start:443 stop:970 length:528 start_codon:yes stop_codon:yes gene_type:complete